MVGASKILTVSYGTFSCTLEGFDDSFDTMKAIAEYFRDLASEDRYFGAEPPAPEPEMLQKIAEREALRRVETRMDDNGIHLRAADSAPAAAPEPVSVQPQPAATPVAEPAPAVATAAPAAAPVAPAAPAFFDTQAEPARRTDIDSFEDEGDLGSVAARLARIRAVVDAPIPVVEDAEPAMPQEPVQEPPVADHEEEVSADTAECFETPDVSEETALDALKDDADDTLSKVADAIYDGTDDVEIEDEPVADDLQASEMDPAFEDIEDEAESAEFQDFDFEEDATMEATSEEDAAEIDEDSAANAQELDLDALAQSLAIGEDAPAEEEETEAAADDAEIDLTALDLSEAPIDATEETSEPENAEFDEGAQEEADAPMQLTGDMAVEEQSEVEQADAAPADEARLPSEATNQALARARARVLKVKRDEDGAEADENMPSDPEPTDAAATEDQGSESSLKLGRPIRPRRVKPAARAEAEAAEAEPQAEETIEAQPEEVAAEIVAEDVQTAAKLADSADEPDESMSRLVDEVNTKMDEQEHKRRRSAIAHLKAAVAATMADRRSRKTPSKEEIDETESQPYREDLEQVVRPKSAATQTQATPLVLVSEQRIDAAPKPEKAVQNKTVMSVGNLAVVAEDETAPMVLEDESFEQFAQRVGAKELPELLEAAGAYQLMVNDEPHFTRPHVMHAAAKFLGSDSFAREDGLRAFGSLLREGPIERVKKGRFTLSKNSRFMC